MLLVILVLLELLLAVGSVGPIFVDRRELARAIADYSRDRTEESRKKMEAEQDITTRIRLHDRVVIVSLLVVNTCGLAFAYRRFRSNKMPNKSLQATAAAPGS